MFDGSSKGMAGFLISIRICVPLIESGTLTSSVRMLPVIHGFRLGYVRMVTVGTTLSMHLLMKLVTEVVYSAMRLDESRNIFQCLLAKQSSSVHLTESPKRSFIYLPNFVGANFCGSL